MISGTSQLDLATFRIASFYKINGSKLSNNFIKIASGTKVPEPKYNIADYFRAKEFNNNINVYKTVQRDIGDALAMIEVAEQAATQVFDDLTEMRDFVKQYYDADATDEQKIFIKEAFDVIASRVNDTINDTYYDGKQLISDTVGAGAPLKSFILNPKDISQTFTIDFDSNDVADTSALDITVGEVAATNAVQAELDKAASYLGKVSGYRAGLNAQYNIVENTVINSKEAVSNMADTDDAKEFAESVKRSISQQSSMAMLAQSNILKQSVLALFM